eukprot:scaffold3639_cov141-Isochrysis_galbana.AAC.7
MRPPSRVDATGAFPAGYRPSPPPHCAASWKGAEGSVPQHDERGRAGGVGWAPAAAWVRDRKVSEEAADQSHIGTHQTKGYAFAFPVHSRNTQHTIDAEGSQRHAPKPAAGGPDAERTKPVQSGEHLEPTQKQDALAQVSTKKHAVSLRNHRPLCPQLLTRTARSARPPLSTNFNPLPFARPTHTAPACLRRRSALLPAARAVRGAGPISGGACARFRPGCASMRRH